MFRKKREEKIKRFIDTITDTRIDLYFVNQILIGLESRALMRHQTIQVKIINDEFYFVVTINKSNQVIQNKSEKCKLKDACYIFISGEYEKFYENIFKGSEIL